MLTYAGKGPGGSDWRKPMDADEAPYNNLQLEHVYGYRFSPKP